MGLSAFSIAVLAGLSADNGADQILARALTSMLACTAVGWVVGLVGERAAIEAIEAYRASNPVGDAGAAAPRQEQADDVITV